MSEEQKWIRHLRKIERDINKVELEIDELKSIESKAINDYSEKATEKLEESVEWLDHILFKLMGMENDKKRISKGHH